MAGRAVRKKTKRKEKETTKTILSGNAVIHAKKNKYLLKGRTITKKTANQGPLVVSSGSVRILHRYSQFFQIAM